MISNTDYLENSTGSGMLINCHAHGNQSPPFELFASFWGVNTPTTVNFKLPKSNKELTKLLNI